MRVPSSKNTRIPTTKAVVYDLHYIVCGRVHEKIALGANRSVARWKAKQLEATTHQIGKVVPVSREV